jgi:hypothetical protein
MADADLTSTKFDSRIKQLERKIKHTPEEWAELKSLHARRIRYKKMLSLVVPHKDR